MKTGVIATIAGIFGLIASVWAGVVVLDDRYVVSSDFEQLQQNVKDTNIILLKGQIWEARKSLMQDPDNEIIQDYLQSLIDQLCVKRPDDAECLSDSG